jgi:hypothetical protein
MASISAPPGDRTTVTKQGRLRPVPAVGLPGLGALPENIRHAANMPPGAAKYGTVEIEEIVLNLLGHGAAKANERGLNFINEASRSRRSNPLSSP